MFLARDALLRSVVIPFDDGLSATRYSYPISRSSRSSNAVRPTRSRYPRAEAWYCGLTQSTGEEPREGTTQGLYPPSNARIFRITRARAS